MAKKKRSDDGTNERDALTAIMTEYDQQCVLYDEFTEKIWKLIEDLIKENGAHVHSITFRIKGRADLKKKLERAEEKYIKLDDVTDISGVRIITYFADEVDKVAEIIQKEFDIDIEHSVDKRALLDPDRFGYLSLHYVAKLPATRLKLTEYQRFSDCKVEIQIRSILQHTWAEIEHDLGYKSQQAVPREIRRRFSRLAGLLELADDEFAQIRNSLFEYETSVPQRIVETPALVLIDKASLWAFVKNNPFVREIDGKIASVPKSRIVENEEYVIADIDKLHYVGLETIADIDSSLREFAEIIGSFAKLWLARSKYAELSAGICLFYLCYVLVARKNSLEEAYNYLKESGIGDPGEQRSIAQKILSTYKQAIAHSE